MKNYYDLLGVDRRASTRAIEQRYRNYLTAHIARHGARPLGRSQRRRLQQMRTAYLLLSSPRRRTLYDRELQVVTQQHAKRVQAAGTVLGGLLLVLGLALIGAQSYLPAHARSRDASHRTVQAEAPAPVLAATETTETDSSQRH
jgi:curved DNA-binding protein CbpA